MRIRRIYRVLLAGAGIIAAAPGHPGVAQGGAPSDVPPLKDAFRGLFPVGTILSVPALQGRSPLEADIASKHFSALTCENSMKPDFTQPREGRFTFADGDRFVDFARRCGAVPVGHTLVWHSQTPKWFFEGPDGRPASRELALERLRTHIATVVGHYRGKVKQWDVVNEAISDAPGEYLRPTRWLKAIGEEYIAEAFRAAHRADPSATLIYNDYNIEQADKRQKAIRLLRSLLAQKAPVNAVGIQCHWRLPGPDFAEVERAIKEYKALGLKVMITELDIGVLPTRYRGAEVTTREAMAAEQRSAMDPWVEGLPDEVARQQADCYRRAFEVFLRHKDAVRRVTLWGTHDGGSWLNDFPVRGRTEYPLLFDRQGRPKPAFHAVREAASAIRAPGRKTGAANGS